MTLARSILSCLVLVGVLVVPGAAHAQTYRCIGRGDAEARDLRDHVFSLVSAIDDTARVHTRVAYRLPGGSHMAVTIETGRHTCARAGRRLNRLLLPGKRPISRRLIVIKVGRSHWVVMDPKVQVGAGYPVWFVFDSKWRKLSAWYG